MSRPEILARQTPPTKLIAWNQRGFDPNGNKVVLSGYGVGTLALASKIRWQVPCDMIIRGFGLLNSTKSTPTIGGATVTVGSGGTVSTVNYTVAMVHQRRQAKSYPAYTATGGRTLTLAKESGGEMMLAQGVRVYAGEYIYIQTCADCAADTDSIPLFTYLDPSIDEGLEVFTVAATGRSRVDNAPWRTGTGIATPGNQKREAASALVRAPGVATIIAEVDGAQECWMITGTSRTINTGGGAFTPDHIPNDSCIAMHLDEIGVPYLLLSEGAAQGRYDLDNEYFALRLGLMKGANRWLNEHGQNDLANDVPLAYLQRLHSKWKQLAHQLGMTYETVTIMPWVQAVTSSGNAVDDYSSGTAPIADTDTNAKVLGCNNWLRGLTSSLSDPLLGPEDFPDKVHDWEAVVGNGAGQYKAGSTVFSGVAETITASALTDNELTLALFSTHGYLLTVSGNVALVRTNGTSTVLTLSNAWSGGTPAAGAYAAKTQPSNDGLHLSRSGKRSIADNMHAERGTAAPTFNVAELPWDLALVPKTSMMFQDTGCSVPAAAANDPVQRIIDTYNSYRGVGTTTTRPAVQFNGADPIIRHDATNDNLDIVLDCAHFARNADRLVWVARVLLPTAAAAKAIAYLSNNAGTSRFYLYFENSNCIALAVKRADADATVAANGSAYTPGSWGVVLAQMDWKTGRSEIWLNVGGTLTRLLNKTDYSGSFGTGATSDTDSSQASISRATVPLGTDWNFMGAIKNMWYTPAQIQLITDSITPASLPNIYGPK